jgi:hypothetical protein
MNDTVKYHFYRSGNSWVILTDVQRGEVNGDWRALHRERRVPLFSLFCGTGFSLP